MRRDGCTSRRQIGFKSRIGDAGCEFRSYFRESASMIHEVAQSIQARKPNAIAKRVAVECRCGGDMSSHTAERLHTREIGCLLLLQQTRQSLRFGTERRESRGESLEGLPDARGVLS